MYVSIYSVVNNWLFPPHFVFLDDNMAGQPADRHDILWRRSSDDATWLLIQRMESPPEDVIGAKKSFHDMLKWRKAQAGV